VMELEVKVSALQVSKHDCCGVFLRLHRRSLSSLSFVKD